MLGAPRPFSHRPSFDDPLSTYVVKVYLHDFRNVENKISVEFQKKTSTEEVIARCLERLRLPGDTASEYEMFEVMGTLDGQACKERRLDPSEYPVAVQQLWPKFTPSASMDVESGNETDYEQYVTEYRFVLRSRSGAESTRQGSLPGASTNFSATSAIDEFLARFLQQYSDREYSDLCLLPELTEHTLLENLRDRFNNGHIYTYIGPILVAVNPFKFYPIYNPKYVRLYRNRRLGDLPPHIFAIADTAYHSMLHQRRNQCIVISGESGSGKTESTNFLLHHLTALSQRSGSVATGVEQTLQCAGPVLEAFGNAVTAQNNNSSRFGKFIQVNYRESGVVWGANVNIYLLEKMRVVSQPPNERNFHVFYYILAGLSVEEKERLHLLPAEDYSYLNKNALFTVPGIDDSYEFIRLRQSMELVGFAPDTQRKVFSVISAVLLLGNLEYDKRSAFYSDDGAFLSNSDVVGKIAELLQVKEDKLSVALTSRRTVARNDTVITRYKIPEALASRDAMAKCLYSSLFDWILLKINQALLKRDTSSMPAVSRGYYVGILDIFGFEDVSLASSKVLHVNSFEQFCINYANERLQEYFNKHIFQLEQEEYERQGICWKHIDYTDNSECLRLLHGKTYGLFHLIDEECSIHKGSDDVLLSKFKQFHEQSAYLEIPKQREHVFIIAHYAGKVKYKISGFREKNKDLVRSDVVSALKNSRSAFVRELVGDNPVAVFRWAVVRTAFRAMFAFRQAMNERRHSSTPEQLEAARNLLKHHQQHHSTSHLDSIARGDFDTSSVPRTSLTPSTGTGPSTSKDPRNNDFVRSRCNRYEDATYRVDLEVRRQRRCRQEKQQRRRCVYWPEERPDPLECAEDLKQIMADFDCNLKKLPRRPRNTQAFGGVTALKMLTNKKNQTAKRVHTVGAQFQISLARLMDSLQQANPLFIRCVRSNAAKIPMQFDEDIILRQLRYTGMLETVHIRRAGYSVRMTYEEFVLHYRYLVDMNIGDHLTLPPTSAEHHQQNKELATALVQKLAPMESRNFQFGHSKIFMRESAKLLLDDQLHRSLLKRIHTLQGWTRTFLDRRRFLNSRKSAIKIQAAYRGHLARLSFAATIAAIVRIQAWWRGRRQRIQYQRRRALLVALQAVCRGYLLRTRMHAGASTTAIEAEMRPDDQLEVDRVITYVDYPDADFEDHDLADQRSDEGILTASSRENVLLDSGATTCSISPPLRCKDDDVRRKETPSSLHQHASEGSSGILADENDGRSERSLSLEAEFIIEDSRLKLIDSPPPGPNTFGRHRQSSFSGQSRTAGALELDTKLTRCASSDSMSPAASPRDARLQLLQPVPTAVKALQSNAVLSPATHRRLVRDLKDTLRQTFRPKRDEYNKYQQRFQRSKAKSISLEKSTYGPVSQIHQLKSVLFNQKQETCIVCQRTITGFFYHGLKCHVCRIAVHKECAGANTYQNCWNNARVQKLSIAPHLDQVPVGRWNLTKTSQFSDPEFIVVNNAEQLQNFNEFIFKKTVSLTSSDSSKPPNTAVDSIFKTSLQAFHAELLHHQATLKNNQLCMRYKDLISMFEGILLKTCKQEAREDASPVQLGTNALRGFVNEFMQQRPSKTPTPTKRRSIKKKRRDNVMEQQGHRFKHDIVHVPTYCEVCDQLMWQAEKIEICTDCRISCHKRCYTSISSTCTGSEDAPSQRRFFGVPLTRLVDTATCQPSPHASVTSPSLPRSDSAASTSSLAQLASPQDDPCLLVPHVLQRLLNEIELRGLFTEGIYRKSGSVSQTKLMRRAIEHCDDIEQLSFEEAPVHVLTALVKSFLRELPEPAMTFDMYDNFIAVADISSERERLACVFSMLELLPRTNRAVVNRLLYHLARVAHFEECNRMSARNLAVIFAPCLLRRNLVVKAQEELQDVDRQTVCIQLLIEEKHRQYVETINDIIALEKAAEKVSANLERIEHKLHERTAQLSPPSLNNPDSKLTYSRQLFSEQLDYLGRERAALVATLPAARAPYASSEDDCLTDEEEAKHRTR